MWLSSFEIHLGVLRIFVYHWVGYYRRTDIKGGDMFLNIKKCRNNYRGNIKCERFIGGVLTGLAVGASGTRLGLS